MTEEEMAKEYADRTRVVDENTRAGTDCISLVQDFEGNYIDISERIIKTFKDAAAFGYNKAKEEDRWHYNDYPKNDDLVLCKDFVDYPFLAYYDGKNWVDTQYETVTCVASWKYITSPKKE